MYRGVSVAVLLSLSLGCLSFQPHRPFHRSPTALLARAKSKWDELTDDEEDLYESITVAPDMSYEPRNLIRQSKNFQRIRSAGGKDVVSDVYIREPETEVFWFVGKIARISAVSTAKAVARQWHMIERHGCNLRPVELMPHRGKLELWAAPGDSELDVAYNRPSCQFLKMKPEIEGVSIIKSHAIGFQGEVYENEEEGFRTWRTDEGMPARREIIQKGATSAPGIDSTERSH